MSKNGKRTLRPVKFLEDADMVGSRRSDHSDADWHMLLLDLNRDARLFASKTPGHFHLIVDADMTWVAYKRLLKALVKAGVVEKAWVDANTHVGQMVLATGDKTGALVDQLGSYKQVSEHVYSGYDSWTETYLKETPLNRSAYIGSRKKDSKRHMLLLDLDRATELHESRHPGHQHLVVDTRMTWPQYKRALKAFEKAGLISWQQFEAARASKQTYLTKSRSA
ncbi:hypothetical protein [Aeromicrobium sp. 179-A 4D2 NHS]|uniref:hypothetical protein n=1 Tax=Aeromicrobium sp. 179-A 4D2 NHS TaxID=3142375 RepID=UPI0039A21CA4